LPRPARATYLYYLKLRHLDKSHRVNGLEKEKPPRLDFRKEPGFSHSREGKPPVNQVMPAAGPSCKSRWPHRSGQRPTQLPEGSGVGVARSPADGPAQPARTTPPAASW